MKRIIAFFVSIWVFFFGKKVVESEKAEPKTLTEKLEDLSPEFKKRYRPQQLIPPHNNRKNTRGRYTQFTPGGKAIYHDIRN